jgi:hypothetical protein
MYIGLYFWVSAAITTIACMAIYVTHVHRRRLAQSWEQIYVDDLDGVPIIVRVTATPTTRISRLWRRVRGR